MAELQTRWLTVKEAAEYTRTDEDWILAHIKSGALKYIPTARRTTDSPKGPRRRILDRIKVDALMERLEVSYEEPAAPDATPETPAAPKPVRTLKKLSIRDQILGDL